MTRVGAPIVPATLRWARQAANITVDELANMIGVAPSRIQNWETGAAEPTIRQIQKVANRLDRTTAFFFIPPPSDTGVPDAVDYRGQGGHGPSSALTRELKRAESYRNFYLEISTHTDQRPSLAAVTWGNISQRASRLRQALDVDNALSRPSSLKGWIGRLEDYGFLIFQTTGIAYSEFRGASVYHDVLPVIILNGADSERGKIFSLFHEIAHLSNRSSAMCLNLEQSHEEVLCNRFSAEFLMPSEAVRQFAENVPREQLVAAVVRQFGVSSLAAAIRLHSLEIISAQDVEDVREESNRNWEAQREKLRDSEGFVPHWRLRSRDLGTKYLTAVFEALEESRIDYIDASYMLNTRVPTVERIQQELHTQAAL